MKGDSIGGDRKPEAIMRSKESLLCAMGRGIGSVITNTVTVTLDYWGVSLWLVVKVLPYAR